MTNYSGYVFSYRGSIPFPLPPLVDTGNATPADPNTLSIEQLNTIGFDGPYTKPTYDPITQILSWDFVTKTFVVIDLGQPSPPSEETDVNARAAIATLINDLTTELVDEPTPWYLEYKNSFILQLSNLLKETRLLCYSDIPKYNPPLPSNRVDAISFVSNLLNESFEAQCCYEKFLFIPHLDPKYKPYVVIPSGWVVNTSGSDLGAFINPETNTVFISGFSPPSPGEPPLISGGLCLVHDVNDCIFF